MSNSTSEYTRNVIPINVAASMCLHLAPTIVLQDTLE